MLEINVPKVDLYDESSGEFITIRGQTIKLEHSLVSLAKWESIWKRAFLIPKQKMTPAETISYIKCMTITQNVNPAIFHEIYRSRLKEVFDYIEETFSATTFNKRDKKRMINREIITAEIIYFWMTSFNIPFSCEKWHLSRLLTLINVCNIKNQTPKKMSKAEILRRNHSLNQARRALLNTPG